MASAMLDPSSVDNILQIIYYNGELGMSSLTLPISLQLPVPYFASLD
jgi:hypothetical protein